MKTTKEMRTIGIFFAILLLSIPVCATTIYADAVVTEEVVATEEGYTTEYLDEKTTKVEIVDGEIIRYLDEAAPYVILETDTVEISLYDTFTLGMAVNNIGDSSSDIEFCQLTCDQIDYIKTIDWENRGFINEEVVFLETGTYTFNIKAIDACNNVSDTTFEVIVF